MMGDESTSNVPGVKTLAKIEAKLKLLNARKATLYQRVQTAYDASKFKNDGSAADEKTKRNFKIRCVSLDDTKKLFDEVLEEINTYKLELGEEPNFAELNSFDTLYCAAQQALTDLNKFENKTGPNPSTSTSGTSPHRARPILPPLEIPHFDGSELNWPFFYRSFKSIIVENPDLSNDDKIRFLSGAVHGKALALVSGIVPVGENFKTMWTTLCDRFEDPRILASKYLSDVLKCKPQIKESVGTIDSFLQEFLAPAQAFLNLNLKDPADFLLYHLAAARLPSSTVRQYELSLNSIQPTEGNIQNLPGFQQLSTFLKSYVKVLSHSNVSTAINNPSLNIRDNTYRNRIHDPSNYKFQSKKPLPASMSRSGNNVRYNIPSPRTAQPSYALPLYNVPSRNNTGTSNTFKCIVCNQNPHHLYYCDIFKDMSIQDRITAVQKHKLCFNCLSHCHRTQSCQSKKGCFQCNQRHHTLLCDKKSPQTPHASSSNIKSENISISAVSSSLSPRKSYSPHTVLLSTALVIIYDAQHKPHVCRSLLDSASQSSFITQSLCDKLGLSTRPVITNIHGIGACSSPIKNECSIKFASRFDNKLEYKTSALILNKITDTLPSYNISLQHLKHLQGLQLADETYHTPGNIDLLIGASLFASLIGPGKVTGAPNTPLALQTTLGYIVMGPVGNPVVSTSHENLQSYCNIINPSLENLVARMWELDDIPPKENISSEEEECEQIFSNTTTRTSNGRYSVDLLFSRDPSLLGNSREIPLNRFYSLEKRLERNPELRAEYNKFMRDYADRGHMSLTEDNGDGCYLPHHCVIKPDSSTTKLRVVWDASCPTSTGYSLNDLLHTGPKLHSDLNNILINFRLYSVAVTADIRQMYRQILVNNDHRKFQKIFWRDSPHDELSVYKLNTVTFGLKSSPYLALKILQKHAENSAPAYPIAAPIIQDGFFVDDLAYSFPTPKEAIKACTQLTDMLKSGGFDLVKWNSNSSEFLNFIKPDDRLNNIIHFESIETKILGLQYNPLSDCFLFNVMVKPETCTKRNILSTYARIFDPLGFLAPITTAIKIIIKEFWNVKLDWDDIPSCPKIIKTWKDLQSQFSLIANVKIPRHIGHSKNNTIDLVGFADASSKAYGAVVYTRTHNADKIIVSLLCAKSRVSPQKSVSIPRLELCAAFLLSRLMNHVITSFAHKIKFKKIIAFSDSSVTLSWILSDSARWKVFVSNRVEKIKNLLPDAQWLHVAGTSNPADCLSRGLSPKSFLSHSLWFSGPQWLPLEPENWPVINVAPGGEELVEEKTSAYTTTKIENISLEVLINNISSYDAILRIIAYCLRWKLYRRGQSFFTFITAAELNTAETLLIKYIQNKYFSEEILALKNNRNLSSRFRKLQPFFDNSGCLVVGGRLLHANLSYQQKHPILLPKEDRLVHLLIDKTHKNNFHTGTATTMALLRQKFWIFGARDLIRKRISSCNICFKHKPRALFPLMGNLPIERVTECKPFLHTGVDYAGPYNIVFSKRRGIRTHKAYLCLFICLSTKAVHLELASDLTTPTFLNALKRFLSRRGPVHTIYSDGGTNFIGAKHHLDKVYELLMSKEFNTAFGDELTHHRITWNQIVPSAPHMGGLWEGNIKSAKSHLKKVIGHQILTYEELNSLFTQVEGLLNSRPLCALSSDPHDLTALTPSHFLTTQPLGHFPSPDIGDAPLNRLTRYQLLEKMTQDFWRRWHIEYLNTLQTREKWNTTAHPIQVGTVVLIRKDNCAPLNWPLGTIESVHPGQDGVIRVVTVNSKGRLYRRPVVKVCPLPTQ